MVQDSFGKYPMNVEQNYLSEYLSLLLDHGPWQTIESWYKNIFWTRCKCLTEKV